MGELIFNGFMLVFFSVMLFFSTQITIRNDYYGARYWPMVLIVIAIVIFSIKVYRIWKKLPAEERKLNIGVFGLNEKGTQRLLMSFALTIAYAALLPYGGYILTTIIFGMLAAWLIGAENIGKMLLAGVGACVPVYAVFVWGLGVMPPRGAGFLYDISLWIERLVR